MESKTWPIGPEQEGERLDVFVTATLEGPTRSAIQKLIKDGRITVNGKPATVHRFLKDGDIVGWDGKEAQPREKKQPVAETQNLKPETSLSDMVLEETDSWLVIDKPAGLLIHPNEMTKTGTLVDLLMKAYPAMSRVGEDPQRPGIVHRIDREVSGLMVVAKTQDAFDDLKAQFAGRTVRKTYLAFCHGSLPDEEGDIKFRIARSTTQPRMVARPQHEKEGKVAWTHYRVKERFTGAILVELEILSGRTHQIRAHLQAMQCPILGDDLYAIKRTDRNVKAPRLMLQSISLAFHDPDTGERKSFELAPVPEFATLTDEFRNS